MKRDNSNLIAERIIKRGHDLLLKDYEFTNFTKNVETDKLLNDLDNFPHAIVLACLMDLQIKAEKAWSIPFLISKEIGGFEFSRIKKLSLDELKQIFKKKKLHRFNDKMAANFFNGIKLIDTKYNGNASLIWTDNQKSSTIVRRFLEFEGMGIKIATMTTNILTRHFKIPMQDRACIDISPDSQVIKVFKRMGFISEKESPLEVHYCARELYPEYPGIFDFTVWEIGRQWCKPINPDCKNCYLGDLCPKII